MTVNAQGIHAATLRAPNASAGSDIDIGGMMARTVPLSIAPSTYSSLTVSDTELFYQSQPLAMIGGNLPGQERSLHAYDLRTGRDRVVPGRRVAGMNGQRAT